MASQGADFFNISENDFSNHGGREEAVKESGPGTFTNVTLSQLATLTRREEGLIIHRQKLQTICTVGIVTKVEELTTKNVYLLDDYTLSGPIEVQLWKDEKESGKPFKSLS